MTNRARIAGSIRPTPAKVQEPQAVSWAVDSTASRPTAKVSARATRRSRVPPTPMTSAAPSAAISSGHVSITVAPGARTWAAVARSSSTIIPPIQAPRTSVL